FLRCRDPGLNRAASSCPSALPGYNDEYPVLPDTDRMETDMTEQSRTAPAPEAGSQGTERRAAPRLPSNLRISCYPVGSSLGERRQGRLRNVSKTGIGLVVDRCWTPGTVLMLQLPAAEDLRLVRARVVHATPQPGGCFLVGCLLDN